MIGYTKDQAPAPLKLESGCPPPFSGKNKRGQSFGVVRCSRYACDIVYPGRRITYMQISILGKVI